MATLVTDIAEGTIFTSLAKLSSTSTALNQGAGERFSHVRSTRTIRFTFSETVQRDRQIQYDR